MPKENEGHTEVENQKPAIGIDFFFKEKVEAPEYEIERVVSSRFKDAEGNPIPFIFRAITPEQMEDIEKASTIKILKRGRPTGETKVDTNKYGRNIAIASCVQPNLKDVNLLKNYGVNTPDALLNQLLPIHGELQEFIQAGLEANKLGFDPEEIMDAAKN